MGYSMAKTSNWAVGSEYDRLLADFLARGGDLSRCPFDTDDYRWEEPPHGIGSDSDFDPVVDEVWRDIQGDGLKGEFPTDEDWATWEREREEMPKGPRP